MSDTAASSSAMATGSPLKAVTRLPKHSKMVLYSRESAMIIVQRQNNFVDSQKNRGATPFLIRIWAVYKINYQLLTSCACGGKLNNYLFTYTSFFTNVTAIIKILSVAI